MCDSIIRANGVSLILKVMDAHNASADVLHAGCAVLCNMAIQGIRLDVSLHIYEVLVAMAMATNNLCLCTLYMTPLDWLAHTHTHIQTQRSGANSYIKQE